MDERQLRSLLDGEAVPRAWYRLEDEPAHPDSTCLEKLGDGWEVSFTVRGQRVVLGHYKKAEDAREFLAAQMLKAERERATNLTRIGDAGPASAAKRARRADGAS